MRQVNRDWTKRTYHVERLDVGRGCLRVDPLQKLLVVLERRQTVQEVLKKLGHFPPDSWLHGNTLLGEFPHVGHHSFVPEVVRECFRPLS